MPVVPDVKKMEPELWGVSSSSPCPAANARTASFDAWTLNRSTVWGQLPLSMTYWVALVLQVGHGRPRQNLASAQPRSPYLAHAGLFQLAVKRSNSIRRLGIGEDNDRLAEL